jgi:hypothetical protein
MKISKRHLRRIIKEEKAKLHEDVTGSAPYSGPHDVVKQLNMLETVFTELKQTSLPAPMDTRIMEALEHLELAMNALYGE